MAEAPSMPVKTVRRVGDGVFLGESVMGFMWVVSWCVLLEPTR